MERPKRRKEERRPRAFGRRRGGACAGRGPNNHHYGRPRLGGNLEGSKLTSTSTQTLDSSVDSGTKGPHSIEIGRGIKDIQAVIVAHRDEARACYDSALKAHPGIEGNLDIRWTIDPKGNVTDVAVDTSHSDILEPTVGNCVIAILKKIHFNESAKGFETQAHYPFNFHPRGRGAVVAPDAGH